MTNWKLNGVRVEDLIEFLWEAYNHDDNIYWDSEEISDKAEKLLKRLGLLNE